MKCSLGISNFLEEISSLSHSLVFFNDPEDVGNFISGSSDFSKSRLNIWKFSVDVVLKPGLEKFEHFASTLLVCEISAIVQEFEHSLALPFLGIGMKADLF